MGASTDSSQSALCPAGEAGYGQRAGGTCVGSDRSGVKRVGVGRSGSTVHQRPDGAGGVAGLWAVLAWTRRQSQQTLADETPSSDAKPTQTSLILADQSVADESLALTAAMAVANAAPQPTALPTVGAPDQATGAVSQPAGATPAASVQAIFSLVERDTRQGPFPSNWFTVHDADQNTGLRVDLPLPDPAVRPSDYADISVINTLDGFNITPRFSIPFNGEIDLDTVNSDTVFLQKLGSTLPNNEGPGNARVGINQIVWDAATTTLHFTADEVLDQHTRYVLVVTTGVKDKSDKSIGSKAFKRFLDDQNFGQTGDPRLKDYHTELLDALAAVQKSGVKTNDVVVASVFTTRSVTTELEKIHEQIQAAPAPTVSDLQTFQLDSVTDITLRVQTSTTGPLGQPVLYHQPAQEHARGDRDSSLRHVRFPRLPQRPERDPGDEDEDRRTGSTRVKTRSPSICTCLRELRRRADGPSPSSATARRGTRTTQHRPRSQQPSPRRGLRPSPSTAPGMVAAR